MENKFILARLDVLDAAIECVIKRQGIIASMLVDQERRSNKSLVRMSEALDDYIEAIARIKGAYEDGRKENCSQER